VRCLLFFLEFETTIMKIFLTKMFYIFHYNNCLLYSQWGLIPRPSGRGGSFDFFDFAVFLFTL
jgi:hypothetical protein